MHPNGENPENLCSDCAPCVNLVTFHMRNAALEDMR